ncbi:histidine phosphatase superfamily [Gongronella butleri]|nr:histidine phosphatase superfamily [Gongronella butleri]
MTDLRITLIRHGNTDANNKRILQGHMDSHLTALGVEQARLAGERLASETFDRIYSSDLTRCKQTSRAISAHHPSVPVEWMYELRECTFGDLDGKSISTVFSGGRCDDNFIMEHGGESLEQFASRVRLAFDKLVASSVAKQDKHVLVVTHGGVLQNLGWYWQEILHYKCVRGNGLKSHGNTAITQVVLSQGDITSGKIEFANCNTHLIALPDDVRHLMAETPPPNV